MFIIKFYMPFLLVFIQIGVNANCFLTILAINYEIVIRIFAGYIVIRVKENELEILTYLIRGCSDEVLSYEYDLLINEGI